MLVGLVWLVNNWCINWNLDIELEFVLDGRCLWWLCGKVLGGFSVINVMCYICGVLVDYDGWVVVGVIGWEWVQVLLWFLYGEVNSCGVSVLYGDVGLLLVFDLCYYNLFLVVFLVVVVQVGYVFNDDFNGVYQFGVGLYQVMQCDGVCCFSVIVYLCLVCVWCNFIVFIGVQVVVLSFVGIIVIGVYYWCGWEY